MLRRTGWWWVAIALFGSAALAPGAALAQDAPALPTLDVVLAEPAAFVGRTITVEGRVAEVMAGQAFTVTPGNGHPGRVLVVSAPDREMRPDRWTGPWARDWKPGDWVLLVGRLDRLDLPTYERTYGVDVSDQFFQPWQGRLAVFAQFVDIVDR